METLWGPRNPEVRSWEQTEQPIGLWEDLE